MWDNNELGRTERPNPGGHLSKERRKPTSHPHLLFCPSAGRKGKTSSTIEWGVLKEKAEGGAPKWGAVATPVVGGE